jgi:hypothetical protein
LAAAETDALDPGKLSCQKLFTRLGGNYYPSLDLHSALDHSCSELNLFLHIYIDTSHFRSLASLAAVVAKEDHMSSA